MKNFIKLITSIAVSAMLFGQLNAAEPCQSKKQWTTQLNSHKTNYSHKGKVYHKDIIHNSTDAYHIEIEEPGSVEITLSSGVLASYDEASCPESNEGLTTINKNFSTPANFNLLVYSKKRKPYRYTLIIRFTPDN